MLKNKKLLSLALLVSLLLFSISACTKEEDKEFESYLPPEEVELAESVQIDQASIITVQDYRVVEGEKDQKILVVNYDWENISPAPLVGMDAYLVVAKQYGTKLAGDLSQVEDIKNLVTELQPGEKLSSIEQGFILEDTSPVTIEISGQNETVFVNSVPQNSYPVKVELSIE